jgi:hypothetical protein
LTDRCNAVERKTIWTEMIIAGLSAIEPPLSANASRKLRISL